MKSLIKGSYVGDVRHLISYWALVREGTMDARPEAMIL